MHEALRTNRLNAVCESSLMEWTNPDCVADAEKVKAIYNRVTHSCQYDYAYDPVVNGF